MESSVQNQIKELEAKINKLRSSQVNELTAQLNEARQVVSDLEAEIAALTGSSDTVATGARRKRTSSDEVRSRILKVLSETTEGGLGQKEIADITGLNYNTVVLFLKNNPKNFKTTGSFRSKRYFLR